MYNEMSYTTSITWILTGLTQDGISCIKKIYYDCELKQSLYRDNVSLPRTLSKSTSNKANEFDMQTF